MDGDTQEALVGVESEETLHRAEEGLEHAISETESEDEDLIQAARPSPTIARSAFVANSALPVSPALSHRRASALFSRRQETNEFSDADSDLELIDADARSMSSAAMQMRDEYDGRTIEDLPAHVSQGARPRTGSTTPSQREASARPSLRGSQRSGRLTSATRSVPETPSNAAKDSSDDDIPAHPPSLSHHPVKNGHDDSMELDSNHGSTIAETIDGQRDAGDTDSEDAEEYIVEAILEHYRDAGKKCYLVKWQGYEDSHDWLPEEDLEGAAELVAEYNARVRKKKSKQKKSA